MFWRIRRGDEHSIRNAYPHVAPEPTASNRSCCERANNSTPRRTNLLQKNRRGSVQMDHLGPRELWTRASVSILTIAKPFRIGTGFAAETLRQSDPCFRMPNTT